MTEFKIVKGKEVGQRRPKSYMKVVRPESTTFHKLKKQVFRWGKKYGPYGVVRQESGSATFYKTSKQEVNIEVLEEFDGYIKPEMVEINANF